MEIWCVYLWFFFFARFLCIGVWCGVDLTVATMAVKSPHNPAVVSSNGHTGWILPKPTSKEWDFLLESSIFKRHLCGQMTPFTFRIGFRTEEQSLQLSLRTFSFSLFNLSNTATTTPSFFMSGIRLHSMETQPEIGLLKLDFWWQLSGTLSRRFSQALPISNIFYLEISVPFPFVSALTFSDFCMCLLSFPLCVLCIYIFFNINFASPYLL